MKTDRILLLALTVATLCSGCASTGYWADRRRDALDIFTFQVGYGLGAKARVGPIQSGLLCEVGGVGLRGGEMLGKKDFWPTNFDTPAKVDLVGLVVGGECFYGGTNSADRGKAFISRQVALATFPDYETMKSQSDVWKPEHHSAPYYSQIEVVVAAGPSLRIGFNPGELLDFILGWFGVDIYHDDLSRRKNK